MTSFLTATKLAQAVRVHNFSDEISFSSRDLFCNSLPSIIEFFPCHLFGSRRELKLNSQPIKFFEGRLACLSRQNNMSIRGTVRLALEMIV